MFLGLITIVTHQTKLLQELPHQMIVGPKPTPFRGATCGNQTCQAYYPSLRGDVRPGAPRTLHLGATVPGTGLPYHFSGFLPAPDPRGGMARFG
jgi:hypothetical protein